MTGKGDFAEVSTWYQLLIRIPPIGVRRIWIGIPPIGRISSIWVRIAHIGIVGP